MKIDSDICESDNLSECYSSSSNVPRSNELPLSTSSIATPCHSTEFEERHPPFLRKFLPKIKADNYSNLQELKRSESDCGTYLVVPYSEDRRRKTVSNSCESLSTFPKYSSHYPSNANRRHQSTFEIELSKDLELFYGLPALCSDEIGKSVIETSDQIDQQELHTRLQTIYKVLESGYTKCKENNYIEKSIIEHLLENVDEYLHFYDRFVRIKTIEMISDNEKLSLNCLCVSINIVNLLMDHVPKSSGIIPRLFSYLVDFQCQDKSNKIARRMQETILYCLINYYDNKVQRELKFIELDFQWKHTLLLCFFYNQYSNKIKSSAAIVLSFNYHQGDIWKEEICQHLINIKSTFIKKQTDKYLGIRGNFIEEAIQNLS